VNAPSEHPQTTSSLVTYSESTSPIINVKKDKEDVKEEKGEKEDNEAIIRIDSYNYGFSPSKIEVEFGKKVRLILKNSGDSYTFTIKEYGISVPVSDEAAIEFVADKKGVFHYKAEGFIYPAEGMLIVS
jgi:plastocyanin